MLTRRQGLALAGLLTATVLTGGIAIAGFAHGGRASTATTPQVQIVQQSPPAPVVTTQSGEEVD